MVKPIPPAAQRSPVKYDESGDTEDLQSLFDSIAASSSNEIAKSSPPADTEHVIDDSGDSPELQALFERVAAQVAEGVPASATVASSTPVASPPEAVRATASQTGQADPAPPAHAEHEHGSEAAQEMFNRLGRMTRELHDTLRQLGYDKVLEDTARAIPDARQRLSYIAQMTEQAASRVLNATEIAKPIQDGLNRESTVLAGRWEKVFANQLSPAEFKALATDTHVFLSGMPTRVGAVNEQLMEIMMAQDFQDLTGQVIKKVVDLAQSMESQLLTLLVDAMPEDVRAETPERLLNGPVINAAGRSDVVTSQEQVDDLLESLGF